LEIIVDLRIIASLRIIVLYYMKVIWQ